MTAQRPKMSYVTDADGNPLTLSDLPSEDTKHWVIRHKANVVCAVRGGLISLDDACRRYKLTRSEFLDWCQTIDRFGKAGLRATRVYQYRKSLARSFNDA